MSCCVGSTHHRSLAQQFLSPLHPHRRILSRCALQTCTLQECTPQYALSKTPSSRGAPRLAAPLESSRLKLNAACPQGLHRSRSIFCHVTRHAASIPDSAPIQRRRSPSSNFMTAASSRCTTCRRARKAAHLSYPRKAGSAQASVRPHLPSVHPPPQRGPQLQSPRRQRHLSCTYQGAPLKAPLLMGAIHECPCTCHCQPKNFQAKGPSPTSKRTSRNIT